MTTGCHEWMFGGAFARPNLYNFIRLGPKPRLFIGLSSGAKPDATAVMRELQRYAEVTPWFAGVFKVSKATL